MIGRLFVGIPGAAIVTLALFTLMQILVQPDRNLIEEVAETISIDITRAQRDEESDTNRELERPTVEDQPPPPPPMDTRTQRPDLSGLNIDIPDLDMNIDSTAIGPVDGEIQPLVRVPPEYPQRAAERGIEGSVCMVFTVTPEGNVTDVTVDSTDSSLLNSAAIRAVSRFRYQPRIVNGEPVPRPGVRTCIDFQLADDRGR